MKVLAFLQNTWVRDVPRCEAILAELSVRDRRRVQQAWLFMGCLTGRRLKAAFGEDGVYDIEWDNASPRLGGVACSVFPPDPDHIRAALEEVQPDVVLVFGKVAEAGVAPLWNGPLLRGPHPAARGSEVPAMLRAMAVELAAIRKNGVSATPLSAQSSLFPT